MPGHVHMRDQFAVRANCNMAADDAVGTNRGVLADHSAIFNPRGGIDRAHRRGLVSLAGLGVNRLIFQWLARAAGAVQ